MSKKYAPIFENVTVRYKKKEFTANPRLIEDKGISKETVDTILGLHHAKQIIFTAMESSRDSKHIDFKLIDKALTQIELSLQNCWGFECDANFHAFWERPGCTCPVMDNKEAYGTKYSIRSTDCPLHGDSDAS